MVFREPRPQQNEIFRKLHSVSFENILKFMVLSKYFKNQRHLWHKIIDKR